MGYNDLVQRGHLVPLELLAEVSRRAVCGASVCEIIEILAWVALARAALRPLRIPDLGPRVSFSEERELHVRASGSRSGLKLDGVELRHAQESQRRPYHRVRNSLMTLTVIPQPSWYCQFVDLV